MFFISSAALPEVRREAQREWRKLEKMVAKRARREYEFDTPAMAKSQDRGPRRQLQKPHPAKALAMGMEILKKDEAEQLDHATRWKYLGVLGNLSRLLDSRDKWMGDQDRSKPKVW